MEITKRIENNVVNIVKTNGDIGLLKNEMVWFQSILWYRKSNEIINLEDFFKFCINFFKGFDITTEISIKC